MNDERVYSQKFIINDKLTESVVTVYDNEDIYHLVADKPYGERSLQNRSGDSKYSDYNYKKTISKRKSTIHNLIYNNFQIGMCAFTTLTFDEKHLPANYTEATKIFKRYVKSIKKKYENYYYVACISIGKFTRMHIHVFSNLMLVDQTKFWKQGISYTDLITTKDEFKRYTNYLIKNVTKTADFTKGSRGYFCSQGLNRPIVVNLESENYVEVFNEMNQLDKRSGYLAVNKYANGDPMIESHHTFLRTDKSELFPKLTKAIKKADT